MEKKEEGWQWKRWSSSCLDGWGGVIGRTMAAVPLIPPHAFPLLLCISPLPPCLLHPLHPPPSSSPLHPHVLITRFDNVSPMCLSLFGGILSLAPAACFWCPLHPHLHCMRMANHRLTLPYQLLPWLRALLRVPSPLIPSSYFLLLLPRPLTGVWKPPPHPSLSHLQNPPAPLHPVPASLHPVLSCPLHTSSQLPPWPPLSLCWLLTGEECMGWQAGPYLQPRGDMNQRHGGQVLQVFLFSWSLWEKWVRLEHQGSLQQPIDGTRTQVGASSTVVCDCGGQEFGFLSGILCCLCGDSG